MVSTRSQTRARKPQLPRELCDACIDYLSDSIETLKSCSLVSRDWLPRSRFHLFHSIAIPCPWAARSNDALVALSNFLFSVPKLSTAVRQLRFTGSKPPASDPHVFHKSARPISQLPFERLRHLAIEPADILDKGVFDDEDARALAELLAKNPYIEVLELPEMSFEALHQLRDVLTAPNLPRLRTIIHAPFTSHPVKPHSFLRLGVTPSKRTRPCIEKLVLTTPESKGSFSRTYNIHQFYLDPGSIVDLTKLRSLVIFDYVPFLYEALFKHCGSTLLELEFGKFGEPAIAIRRDWERFSHLTALTKLVYTFSDPFFEFCAEALCSTLPRLPALEHVTLNCTPHDRLLCLSHRADIALSQLLTTAPQIKEIVFNVHDGQEPDTAQHFPRSRATGRLRVSLLS